LQECIVTFRDSRGVEHRVSVEAHSLFEAVCKAWPKFAGNYPRRLDDLCGLTVSVELIPKSFEVNLEKLFLHLSSSGRSPKDRLNRGRLLRLLRGENQ
jgi:hypothetical protein